VTQGRRDKPGAYAHRRVYSLLHLHVAHARLPLAAVLLYAARTFLPFSTLGQPEGAAVQSSHCALGVGLEPTTSPASEAGDFTSLSTLVWRHVGELNPSFQRDKLA
jgi:hypothetical protein